MNIKNIDWEKIKNLVPVIVQHYETGQVLMLGYMNQQALTTTLQTNKLTFYTRSRKSLWTKGETSGNYLNLKQLDLDCDQDAILALVEPEGPTCHLGNNSCFNSTMFIGQTLTSLESVIKQREVEKPANSYTCELLDKGINKIAQKVGEEAVETVIAALKEDDERLCNEMADLLYHLLVLLRARNLPISSVFNLLTTRTG